MKGYIGNYYFVFIIILSLVGSYIGKAILSKDHLSLFLVSGTSILFGYTLLIYSKFELIKRKVWFSFGTKGINKEKVKYYYFGYFLILLGLFFLLINYRLIFVKFQN
jgi:hypothetical protein